MFSPAKVQLNGYLKKSRRSLNQCFKSQIFPSHVKIIAQIKLCNENGQFDSVMSILTKNILSHFTRKNET